MVVTIAFDTRRRFHIQYLLSFVSEAFMLSPLPSADQERSSVLGHGVAPLAVVLSQGAPRLRPYLSMELFASFS